LDTSSQLNIYNNINADLTIYLEEGEKDKFY